MGLFGDIFKALLSDSASQRQPQRRAYEPPKRYTPEEFVILEQEQSGETWHGVPLSELSKLAQETYRGRYVKVDQYNFLVFHYASKSRKTRLSVQCDLDENGQLRRLLHNYYPGQWTDSADDFVRKANQQFTFR
jgi:hypothetical protein